VVKNPYTVGFIPVNLNNTDIVFPRASATCGRFITIQMQEAFSKCRESDEKLTLAVRGEIIILPFQTAQ